MNIGFVIGNGESRLEVPIDFSVLKSIGPLYACNAFYRTFSPDMLVIVDIPMLKEIRRVKYALDFAYWDRHDKCLAVKTNGTLSKIPYKGYAAGQTALHLLCFRHLLVDTIFMLGFDFYSKTDKINNVFKNTEAYRPKNSKPVNPTSWIKQTCLVISDYPNKQFYRVMPENWKHIQEFEKYKNVQEITYKQMNETLDGGLV